MMKYRKLYYLFFLLLFLSTNYTTALLDSGGTQTNVNTLNGIEVDYPKFEIIKNGDPFNLTIFNYNITDGRILSGSNCSLQVFNKSGSRVFNVTNLTQTVNAGYNTFIAGGNFTINNHYAFDIYCENGLYGGFASGLFEINGTGFEFTVAKSIFYIAMLVLLGFLFILNGIGIAKLPKGNPRSDSGKILSISKLKYFTSALFVLGWGLIVAILLISSSVALNYLGEQALGFFLFRLFKLSEIFMLPMLFIWIVYIMINVFQDFKLKDLFDRGYDPT